MNFVAIVGWIGTALLMLAWLFPAGGRKFLSICLLSNIVWIWFGIMSPNAGSLIFINTWMFINGVRQLANTIEPADEEDVYEIIEDIEKERMSK